MASMGRHYDFIPTNTKHIPPGTVPRPSHRDMMPPCTAPRSTSLDHRSVAAVTPENELEARAITSNDSLIIHQVPPGKASTKKRKSDQKEKTNDCNSKQQPLQHYHPGPFPLPQQSLGDPTSLSSLTARFVDLLNRATPPYGNGELDLNVAMAQLGVQKRRLYDITNVLEGIGLIIKQNKNFIAWAPKFLERQSVKTEVDQRKEQCFEREIADLKSQSKSLDGLIERLTTKVRAYTAPQSKIKSKDKASGLYVTKREISSIQNYANDTVIAIRAPSGTSLEVPNPDEGMRPGMRRFQIYLNSPPSDQESSSSGQVDVFLVQHGDNGASGTSRHFRNRPSSKHHSDSNRHNKPTKSTSDYPLQQQRSREHGIVKKVEKNTAAHHCQSYDSRLPQLPPTESLPKYISPISTRKFAHMSRPSNDCNLKPSQCFSSQTKTQSNPTPSYGARCPMLKPTLKRRRNNSPKSTKQECTDLINALDQKGPKKLLSSNKANVSKKARKNISERVTSPLPSAMLSTMLEKIRSSPSIEKNPTKPAPLTPSDMLKGSKISTQSSFDLLTAPLSSPSIMFTSSPVGLLASPTMTKSLNFSVMGSSAFGSSPFQFSPNFQNSELSPFLPTPIRSLQSFDKSENVDDSHKTALF